MIKLQVTAIAIDPFDYSTESFAESSFHDPGFARFSYSDC